MAVRKKAKMPCIFLVGWTGNSQPQSLPRNLESLTEFSSLRSSSLAIDRPPTSTVKV